MCPSGLPAQLSVALLQEVDALLLKPKFNKRRLMDQCLWDGLGLRCGSDLVYNQDGTRLVTQRSCHV
jgi:hypothetical protein